MGNTRCEHVRAVSIGIFVLALLTGIAVESHLTQVATADELTPVDAADEQVAAPIELTHVAPVIELTRVAAADELTQVAPVDELTQVAAPDGLTQVAPVVELPQIAAPGELTQLAAADEFTQIASARSPLSVLHDASLRTRVSTQGAPWRSVGKLQGVDNRVHTACTGALVGPHTVLTAAHCMFNPRTKQPLPPRTLHFLLGFEFEGYAGHAVVTSFVTGAGFQLSDTMNTRGADWALLTLDRDIGAPDRILPIRIRPAAVGTSVLLGGYSQMQPYILTASSTCKIVGQVADREGRPVLRHDCESANGISGAPLLMRDGTGWSIVGVHVAQQRVGHVMSGAASMLEQAHKRL